MGDYDDDLCFIFAASDKYLRKSWFTGIEN